VRTGQQSIDQLFVCGVGVVLNVGLECRNLCQQGRQAGEIEEQKALEDEEAAGIKADEAKKNEYSEFKRWYLRYKKA